MIAGRIAAMLAELGIAKLNDQSFTSYSIDVKALFGAEQYLPAPPAGLTWNDAQIGFAEVYASVRGADLAVRVKNADLTD